MPTRDVALRYMARFTCIGSACEDTCCSGGWAIFVDKKHHRALQRAMSRTTRRSSSCAWPWSASFSSPTRCSLEIHRRLESVAQAVFLLQI